MRLSEFPHQRPSRVSAIDQLPQEILDQMIESRVTGTHYVSEIVEWLHSPDFDGEYDHIAIPMLTNWFSRRGYRAQT